ncbi:MAG: SDR family NAD(P)-dependent oxidoreductase [Pseudomonadota bacterium]
MSAPWPIEGSVAVVTGVGPGTGAALATRFAAGGYRVAMLARSEERLAALAETLSGAVAFPCDIADEAALAACLAEIRDRLGAPRVIVHNAVGGAFGDFMETNASILRRNFEVNVTALLHLAQATAPAMIEQGGGAIVATGNTAAYRGKPAFAGFAPTKAAQRILLESIARSAGPKGVHAAYVAIDAVIDTPRARRMAPDQPDAFFAKPADIAEEVWRIAHQPRSTWSFDSVIRPFGEAW